MIKDIIKEAKKNSVKTKDKDGNEIYVTNSVGIVTSVLKVLSKIDSETLKKYQNEQKEKPKSKIFDNYIIKPPK